VLAALLTAAAAVVAENNYSSGDAPPEPRPHLVLPLKAVTPSSHLILVTCTARHGTALFTAQHITHYSTQHEIPSTIQF